MEYFDKIYLSKLAMDLDPKYTDLEDIIDFDFSSDNETYQFIDDDINELDDLFWKD